MIDYQAHLRHKAPYSYDTQQQLNYSTQTDSPWKTLAMPWAVASLVIFIPIALNFLNASDLFGMGMGLLLFGWLWHQFLPFGGERSLIRCIPIFTAVVWIGDAVASFLIPVFLQAVLAVGVLIWWGVSDG